MGAEYGHRRSQCIPGGQGHARADGHKDREQDCAALCAKRRHCSARLLCAGLGQAARRGILCGHCQGESALACVRGDGVLWGGALALRTQSLRLPPGACNRCCRRRGYWCHGCSWASGWACTTWRTATYRSAGSLGARWPHSPSTRRSSCACWEDCRPATCSSSEPAGCGSRGGSLSARRGWSRDGCRGSAGRWLPSGGSC
mmetsp:Transcript_22693/g.57175  ORF Transcript_22693/g.57175 Transcript_22693/m.57175 type:complete len:201 (-) Transcript_22693:358-960(-)